LQELTTRFQDKEWYQHVLHAQQESIELEPEILLLQEIVKPGPIDQLDQAVQLKIHPDLVTSQMLLLRVQPSVIQALIKIKQDKVHAKTDKQEITVQGLEAKR